MKGEEQCFRAEWYETFSWLHYDIVSDAAFCYICMTNLRTLKKYFWDVCPQRLKEHLTHKRNPDLGAGIKREWAGRKLPPIHEWQVVQNMEYLM